MKTTDKSTRGTIVFYAIYFLLVAVAASGIIILLGRLWDFLTHYEQSQLYHVTDAVAEQLNSGDFSLIYDGLNVKVSPYENEETLRSKIREQLSGTISFVKDAKQSTDNRPVYYMVIGEEKVGRLSLRPSGLLDKFGFEQYEPERIYDVTAKMNEFAVVTLPSSCTFTVNGIPSEKDASFIEKDIPETELFGSYLGTPLKMRTYPIGGLLEPPEIKFYDSKGKEIPAKADAEKRYLCPLPCEYGSDAEAAGQFALDFSHLYSEYIANDVGFAALAEYIPEETTLYGNLETYEGQFYTWHSDYGFENDEILSVIRYSEDCFAVRVTYTHVVNYLGESYSYPADYTVCAVRNGEGWNVVNLVMN